VEQSRWKTREESTLPESHVASTKYQPPPRCRARASWPLCDFFLLSGISYRDTISWAQNIQTEGKMKSLQVRFVVAVLLILLAFGCGLPQTSGIARRGDASAVAVSVGLAGGAQGKGLLSDSSVASVRVEAFDSSSISVGSGDLARSGDRFLGSISVSKTGILTFKATAKNASSQALYQGFTKSIIYGGERIIIVLAPLTGLIGEYLFDGGCSDSSPNGNDYTAYGAPTYTTDRFGNANSALLFDGVYDYLDRVEFVGNESHYSGGFSISLWINPSASPDSFYARITDFGTAGTQYRSNIIFGRHETDSNIVMQNIKSDDGVSYDNPEMHLYAPGEWVAGVWTHFVYTVDPSGNAVLYRNGTAVDTIDDSSALSSALYPVKVIERTQNYIGRSHFGNLGDNNYAGVMDDIRLYNKPLSAEEVSALYHEGDYAAVE
jgi:hypothetical protein